MGKIKSLSSVQKFLNKISYINNGGCGISAISMYRWIRSGGDKIKIKFVFLYNYGEEEEYLNNQKVLKNKHGRPQAPTHCCIYHKKKFKDSEGNIDVDKYKWIQIVNEEEFLKNAINNIGSWNDWFERDNIDEIEKKLNIDLSDIKRD